MASLPDGALHAASLPNASDDDSGAVLPDGVPVAMPDLPPSLPVTTAQQFKAFSDPTRVRILGIIQNQPATAKQIADRLQMAPGTIGHHLQVLEAAGLAQVVARRLVHGIVAKYYTRTARIFAFDLPREVTGNIPASVMIVSDARDELAEALAATDDTDSGIGTVSFPHARLSHERARVYQERLQAIVEDLLHERPDPDGQVYGICIAMFPAPAYLQSVSAPESSGFTSMAKKT
jgi:DNA-binding transcriptional ArsR family regulator